MQSKIIGRTWKTKEGRILCSVKKRAGDKVALRLAEAEKFATFANGFFKLKYPLVFSWGRMSRTVALYCALESKEGQFYHEIKLSKNHCTEVDYTVGSIIHELIHAKEAEILGFDKFGLGGGLVHGAYFWQQVEQAAKWFGIKELDIANRESDID